MDVSMIELQPTIQEKDIEGKDREEGNGKPPRLFSLYSVRQKKVSPKFFCHFLSNRSEFLNEISHIY